MQIFPSGGLIAPPISKNFKNSGGSEIQTHNLPFAVPPSKQFGHEGSLYTANVLAVNSTFYICVKNPLTVSCDFSRYLSVVYQDQYSALFTEK